MTKEFEHLAQLHACAVEDGQEDPRMIEDIAKELIVEWLRKRSLEIESM